MQWVAPRSRSLVDDKRFIWSETCNPHSFCGKVPGPGLQVVVSVCMHHTRYDGGRTVFFSGLSSGQDAYGSTQNPEIDFSVVQCEGTARRTMN